MISPIPFPLHPVAAPLERIVPSIILGGPSFIQFHVPLSFTPPPYLTLTSNLISTQPLTLERMHLKKDPNSTQLTLYLSTNPTDGPPFDLVIHHTDLAKFKLVQYKSSIAPDMINVGATFHQINYHFDPRYVAHAISLGPIRPADDFGTLLIQV